MTSNSCRHFIGMFPDNRPACAKGRDVRDMPPRDFDDYRAAQHQAAGHVKSYPP